ncbi:hypothetical protein DFA_07061 [Cavenderia fasciculata]|uniref:SAP domain-containing protein n=1 Tax=Cavenderia fasciculata TaxID=261658 RepID=F4PVD7_CACFS|nr:uncharacterized protein DFA_07061 [Cavenderia fasciculata]EGG19951.1 hypothetical protein DFA_07061 [Cavenderia fasciculata]|eukprot:XP_004366934.1 hypothetical protein DFA_07061 [Cavenderia fasciculata]
MPSVKDEYTQDQLLNMLYKEVTTIAIGLNLPCNGKKDEIVQRIIDLQSKSNKKEEEEEEEESDEDEQEKKVTSKLGKINIKQVKEEDEEEEDEEEEEEEEEEHQEEEEEEEELSEFEEIEQDWISDQEESEEESEGEEDRKWKSNILPRDYLPKHLADLPLVRNSKLIQRYLTNPARLNKLKRFIPEVWFDNMMGSDGAEALYEDGLHKLHPRIAFIYHVHREQFNDGTCELEDSMIKKIRRDEINYHNDDWWMEIYKQYNK